MAPRAAKKTKAPLPLSVTTRRTRAFAPAVGRGAAPACDNGDSIPNLSPARRTTRAFAPVASDPPPHVTAIAAPVEEVSTFKYISLSIFVNVLIPLSMSLFLLIIIRILIGVTGFNNLQRRTRRR